MVHFLKHAAALDVACNMDSAVADAFAQSVFAPARSAAKKTKKVEAKPPKSAGGGGSNARAKDARGAGGGGGLAGPWRFKSGGAGSAATKS